jgi:hypothetical protein
MIFSFLAVPAVILLFLCGVTLLVSNNWRISVGALGVMYLASFILVANSWPVNLAVIKLVTGWMAGSVLGITSLNVAASRSQTRGMWPTQSIFYFLASLLVLATTATFVPVFLEWIPSMKPAQAWGGFILIGTGLLHLGFSARAMRVTISLLTMLAGFEIVYAAVETSTLVAGLLSLVNLGITLAGAYLILNPILEERLS